MMYEVKIAVRILLIASYHAINKRDNEIVQRVLETNICILWMNKDILYFIKLNCKQMNVERETNFAKFTWSG